jgi:prevent-host-death family protein
MASVSIRDLSRNTSSVVADVTRTGRPALITKHGAPVVAVIPIDPADLEDVVLATAEEYLADMAAAERDLRAGRTTSGGELLAELKAEEGADPH